MKKIITCSLLIAAGWIMTSCGQQPQTSAGFPEGRSATDYFIESVKGSEIQKARRYNDKGILVEEGFLYNGVPNGTWTEYNIDRITRATSYVGGYKHGVELVFSNREQIDDKSYFELGMKNGRAMKYEFGRLLEEATYKEGKLEGKMIEYHPNGNVKKEVEYKGGVQHGLFRYYDPEGTLTLEYEYANGEKVSGGMVGQDR